MYFPYTSLEISRDSNTALVTLSHGKVNAIDHRMLSELTQIFQQLETAPYVASVILTGNGKFFSFGFDVPALYDLPPDDFTQFLKTFCNLCRTLFLFPKPLVAAINGHAVAGGCILALTADYRIMNAQSGKVSLNEITFGSGLFPAAVEMLRFAVGNRCAEEMLLSGRMLSGVDAHAIGLVDELVEESHLIERASRKTHELSRYTGPAYANLKRLARQPVADTWLAREDQAIKDFVTIWYSPHTRALLKSVQIRN